VATLVAFHTETCAPCRLQQNPAIDEVQRQYGRRLAVRHVDVGEEREVAGALGVWTVPTTLLFDARGRIRAVNDSLALAPQLRRQVAEVLGSS
jgi:thioredoxin-like negative regulator of GroEL